MKVLVTGAAGCLGRATCERLHERGHSVRGHDLDGKPSDALFRDVDWMSGDLGECELAPLLEGCSAVAHFAALVHREDVTAPEQYRRINVEMTRRLVDAATAANVRVVLSSTVAVYGPLDEPADEATRLLPETAYARSKLSAEQIVRSAGGVVLRFPVAYGPGDRGNVGKLIDAIRRGRFVLPTPADRPRSMIAAANAGAGVVAAVENCDPAGTYLITDGRDVTLRDLVQAVSAALEGRPQPLEVPASLLRPLGHAGSALAMLGVPVPLTTARLEKLVGGATFSCRLATERLGYEPVVSFEQAIREAVHSRLSSTPSAAAVG